jgi:hypothetical protein
MRYRDGALPPPEEVLVIAVAELCVPVAPVGNRSRDVRLDESCRATSGEVVGTMADPSVEVDMLIIAIYCLADLNVVLKKSSSAFERCLETFPGCEASWAERWLKVDVHARHLSTS